MQTRAGDTFSKTRCTRWEVAFADAFSQACNTGQASEGTVLSPSPVSSSSSSPSPPSLSSSLVAQGGIEDEVGWKTRCARLLLGGSIETGRRDLFPSVPRLSSCSLSSPLSSLHTGTLENNPSRCSLQRLDIPLSSASSLALANLRPCRRDHGERRGDEGGSREKWRMSTWETEVELFDSARDLWD